MKLKVIHRNPSDFSGKKAGDVQPYFRNRDPNIHPFERAREYTRALTATKLDKIFAKPLVSVLDGHTDSIKCIARAHQRISDIFTASCDGEIRFWNVGNSECLKSLKAHDGFIRGLCTSNDDKWLFSGGDDKVIRQWDVEKNFDISDLNEDEMNSKGNLVGKDADTSLLSKIITPVNSFQAKSIQTCLDHHPNKYLILSCGDTADIWDYNRSFPIHSFQWGCCSLYSGKFNPSEHFLIGSTGTDNSIGLYDIRSNSPIRKVVLKMASNSICWNPMNPLNFIVCNEDHNLYTFDMRKLSEALFVHKDFTNAVLDVDFSPTGKEFVCGSFDRTIRIFDFNAFKSKNVYHTKRMQYVLSCKYSCDGRYIFSGSADMCLRIWKSDASAPLGVRNYRERQAIEYRRRLKEKYSHLPEIKRILRHHHVPILIKKTAEKNRIIEEARKRKERNIIKHSKEGEFKVLKEKEKCIVQELE